jgi:hypothetical protein
MFLRVPTGVGDNFLVRRRADTEQDNDENERFKDLEEFWKHYWLGLPSDQPPVHERSSLPRKPSSFPLALRWFKSFDATTGRPRRGDDFRLWSFLLWKSPAMGTAVDMTDPDDLGADLNGKLLAATGSGPVDRGCYPPNGEPLRVGVRLRRVFPSPNSDLEPDTHDDDGWPRARMTG